MHKYALCFKPGACQPSAGARLVAFVWEVSACVCVCVCECVCVCVSVCVSLAIKNYSREMKSE